MIGLDHASIRPRTGRLTISFGPMPRSASCRIQPGRNRREQSNISGILLASTTGMIKVINISDAAALMFLNPVASFPN